MASLRQAQAVKQTRGQVAERRVNKMFDPKRKERRVAKNPRRAMAMRTGAQAAKPGMGAGLRTAGRAALHGLRFAGPIAAAGLAGREIIDQVYKRKANKIAKGGGVNSPATEKNRTISTATQAHKFKMGLPTQRKRRTP